MSSFNQLSENRDVGFRCDLTGNFQAKLRTSAQRSCFLWLLTERANFHQFEGNEVCVREEEFLEIDGVKPYDFS